jgi:hypothetical protein
MGNSGNVPIHNTDTKEVQEHLTNLRVKGMKHPPYRLDPLPCDFFLFGVMKENFSGQPFECVGELCLSVEAF